MSKYDSYKKAWKNRRRETVEHNQMLADRAREEIKKIAKYLGEQYGVKHVYLFGSILKKGKFNKSSDLDIAVAGLQKADFYKALAEISQMTEFNLDLKPLEDCAESFQKRVKEEGALLYERRRSTSL